MKRRRPAKKPELVFYCLSCRSKREGTSNHKCVWCGHDCVLRLMSFSKSGEPRFRSIEKKVAGRS